MKYPLVASSGMEWRPGLLEGDSLGSEAIDAENNRNLLGSCKHHNQEDKNKILKKNDETNFKTIAANKKNLPTNGRK